MNWLRASKRSGIADNGKQLVVPHPLIYLQGADSGRTQATAMLWPEEVAWKSLRRFLKKNVPRLASPQRGEVGGGNCAAGVLPSTPRPTRQPPTWPPPAGGEVHTRNHGVETRSEGGETWGASFPEIALSPSRDTPTAGNKGTHQRYVLAVLNVTPLSGVICHFLFLGSSLCRSAAGLRQGTAVPGSTLRGSAAGQQEGICSSLGVSRVSKLLTVAMA